MTFKISRTSDFVFDKSRLPCKNAEVGEEEYEERERIFFEETKSKYTMLLGNKKRKRGRSQ